MKRLNMILLATAVAVVSSSCSVGRKLSFENTSAGPGYQTSRTALVVFQDRRPDVLSGKEKPSFCGHNNSTVQISYNIQTENGNPLADEFATAVSNAYNKSGASANVLKVNMNAEADSILQSFRSGSADRLLFFTINKWESRAAPTFTTIRYEVIYQLVLNVYGKGGELLATNSTQDIVSKEEGIATSMKKMQEMADNVFREQVTFLFNSGVVKNSLQH